MYLPAWLPVVLLHKTTKREERKNVLVIPAYCCSTCILLLSFNSLLSVKAEKIFNLCPYQSLEMNLGNLGINPLVLFQGDVTLLRCSLRLIKLVVFFFSPQNLKDSDSINGFNALLLQTLKRISSFYTDI